MTDSGYDAPFHLSEECSNANIAAPRAIVLTSGVGGLFGWFLQLVVAYTVIDIDAVLDSDLGQPWASYLLQVLPQKTALAALSLTIIAAFSMGQGCMVAASRVTFAYARDDCFPCSWWIQRVNRHTRTPVNAVWFNTSIGILMTLLIFGGELAAGALFSIAAVAAFVAFTIPIFIRVFFVGNRFRPGPWHLGKASMPIGVCACAFVALMVPILNLPSVTGSDLDASGMNWTCLVWGAPMLMVTIWWFVDARKWFKGPKVCRDFLFWRIRASCRNWLTWVRPTGEYRSSNVRSRGQRHRWSGQGAERFQLGERCGERKGLGSDLHLFQHFIHT